MCELINAGSGNPLEQFVLLAKNAKGAAAVELIKQALEVKVVLDEPMSRDNRMKENF